MPSAEMTAFDNGKSCHSNSSTQLSNMQNQNRRLLTTAFILLDGWAGNISIGAKDTAISLFGLSYLF
tara:strand:+ start:218 stop:418 length:201 start_codon:yes stop_codon:yes gene_type:complete